MDITLRVTPEILKTKAAEIERDISTLESCFNNIQDIVSRSTGYWVGAAGDSTRKKFDKKKNDMDMVIRRFREQPADLLIMAGIYDRNEQALASANQGLDTSGIV